MTQNSESFDVNLKYFKIEMLTTSWHERNKTCQIVVMIKEKKNQIPLKKGEWQRFF